MPNLPKLLTQMEIGLYEEWMKPQIVKLFSIEYGVTEKYFSQYMDNLYEHPFSKDKCVRMVAKEGNTIIGFLSFFYWPYTYKNKVFHSFQTGNAITHPEHRGKRVFQKLLEYLDVHRKKLNIEFSFSFPFYLSVGSFMRNKYIKIFKLQWYVKLVNPFSLFLPLNLNKLERHFPNKPRHIKSEADSDFIKLSHSKDFTSWRQTHYPDKKYLSFHYTQDDNELVLQLKVNVRKKLIKELIIGNIITTSYEPVFINKAFDHFFKEVKKTGCISIISIAVNEQCEYELPKTLPAKGFRKINKQINVCVKPFSDNPLFQQAEKWIVYSGDIDTW